MNGNNRESTTIEPKLSVSKKKWLASLSMLVFLLAIVLTISVPFYSTYIEEAKRSAEISTPSTNSTPSPVQVKR